MKARHAAHQAIHFSFWSRTESITEGTVWKALLSFFFPILAGTLFQQLYNTIDAFVVGRFVGTEALAAVGGTTAVYVNLLVGFFTGLSSGAGVLISQFYGAGDRQNISRAVHTALVLSIAGGAVIMALGMACTDLMLSATRTPADVAPLSHTYLLIYFAGTVPMFVYNMGAGILRATGDSRTPLVIIAAGCAANIALDLLLVPILRQGVRGVALATVICQVLCAAICLCILRRPGTAYTLRIRELRASPHILREMLRIGFPAGIQSSLYTISNLIIQTNFNIFGTKTVAAWAAFGKIDAIFWMIVSAFGIAVTTFAGQNAGARHFDRIKKGMWQTLLMTAATAAVLLAVFWYGGETFYRLFSNDEAVIACGMDILRFMVPFWITYISIEVLSGTIRGAGDSLVPMLITVFGVCGLRILWIFTAVRRTNTLHMVLASYPITWIVTSIAFWLYYLSGRWLKKLSA